MRIRTLLATSALALAISTPAVMAAGDTLDLVEPLAAYKIYVSEHTADLVSATTEFTAAIKDGDVEKAKELYAPGRMDYERIEPIAELFADLDASIDARADDYEQGEEDPAFTGFHRIEYGLWEEGSTDGLTDFADQLQTDVEDLSTRIAELTFPPETVVGGAAALMEEVAASKISGEEDRYSHTDLWDFQANVDGAKKIFDLFSPMVDDAEFVTRVDDNFNFVNETLDTYKTADGGYETYDKLTEEDRNALSAAVNTLAEDLSTLRGKLGLD